MMGPLFAKNLDYLDSDLTFLVHSFHDSVQLRAMLAECRLYYPQARVIVCSDGDENPDLTSIAQSVNAEFHRGENLYAQGNGGKVCHRMLELFLRRPTRYLFKVDPDTGFHRRFEYLPAASGMFGTLQSSPLLCSIQGGCCGITLDWAATMYTQKLFLDAGLLDAPATWATYEPLWRHMQRVRRVSSDWIFGYVATAIGCPQFGFPEVRSHWRSPVENRDLLYAITHPVHRPD
ncbi:MAG: hypothetical protein ACO1RT_04455 [Planctomycetaceae bacterium]